MKNTRNKLLVLIFFALAFPPPGPSQGSLPYELSYDIYINYPPLSMTKEKLRVANTLPDLYKQYKPSWVKEYISVEISASQKGKTRKAVGINDTLTQEQKELVIMADADTDIAVKVRYIPENNLKYNPPREIDFTFRVDPDSAAEYPGGPQQLKRYLKEKAIDKIPGGVFRQYQLTVVKFTIDETGQVADPHVFWTSEDEKIDALLMEAICNMPNWKPATYANGLKVKQEFAFTVGDMESCVVNLINIRRD